MAKDNPVTICTVGADSYRNDPAAKFAVQSGLSQEEFIRLLLADRKELTTSLVCALKHQSVPTFVNILPFAS